jgi:nitroreductase
VDVFEAIATTRAMRRLDPDRPVSDDDLLTIVEAATKGPTGGNRQPVRWLVVVDDERRRQLGAVYAACWEVYQQGNTPRDTGDDPAQARVRSSAAHLGAHMGDAPAIVLPCARRGIGESSVFPGVQNLCLAARALGLGTTITTIHRIREDEVKALLGVPDDVVVWAMIPVGHPTGRWGEAVRRPVPEVTYWNAWKVPPPPASPG